MKKVDFQKILDNALDFPNRGDIINKLLQKK